MMRKDTTKKLTRQYNIPMRRCTGCMTSFPKNELIRVIRTPEGHIELDLTGRKNGRGAYICNNETCFKKAVKNRGIERALNMKVSDELYMELKGQLANES